MVLYYHALVSHVDDQIGRILSTLEATGLARRTIVIFTSDHGEYLGDHGRIQKGMPHSVITNVPCIVRLPDAAAAGRPVAEVVEQIDVTATILDYCGVQVPRFVQGSSLRPLLAGTGGVAQERCPYRGVLRLRRLRQRHAADRPLPVRL